MKDSDEENEQAEAQIDAVEIIHRRYYEGRPQRMAENAELRRTTRSRARSTNSASVRASLNSNSPNWSAQLLR